MLDFPIAMKELHYKNYFRKILTKVPESSTLMYFYDNSVRLWILDWDSNDIKKILKIEHLCKVFYHHQPKILIELLNWIIWRLHDSRTILENNYEKYREIAEDKLESKFSSWFDLYKSFFESEFSLWSSILFSYVIEFLDLEKNDKNDYKEKDIDYILLPWSKKFNLLKNNKYWLDEFVELIDSNLRNSWSWHEKFEFLDNWNCVLKNINDKTWKEKSRIEITLKQLNDNIKKIEKSCLILELWIHVFINNYNIEIKPTSNSEKIKVKYIERVVKLKVNEFQLKLNKFEFINDRKILNLEFWKNYIRKNIWVSTLYTDRSAHEIVQKIKKVKYIEQIFWILQKILYLNNKEWFDVNIKQFDYEENLLFEINFNKDEVVKLWYEWKIYPNSSSWLLPEDEYELIADIKVPIWYWNELDLVLKNPLFTKEYLDFLYKEIAISELIGN